jgi:hypothetical protein
LLEVKKKNKVFVACDVTATADFMKSASWLRSRKEDVQHSDVFSPIKKV